MSHANAAAQEIASPLTDSFNALGARLLAALPVLRLHSVSLFDARGLVQWLNEGSLGPDEQALVEAALKTFKANGSKAHTQETVDDGRGALFLAVRPEPGTLVGVVMLLMDARTLGSGNLAARILTSQMREVLQQAAATLEEPVRAVRPLQVAMDADLAKDLKFDPELPTPEISLSSDALDLATDLAIDLESESAPMLALEPVPMLEPVTALDLNLATTGSNPRRIILAEGSAMADATGAAAVVVAPENPGAAGADMLLQELERLRPGGRTRHFKVSPEDERLRGNATATLEQLLAWLRAHPQALQGEPLSFTIAVSGSALKDTRLPLKLSALLADSPLPAAQIGFEVREPACIALRPQVERLLDWCEHAGCVAVIDDFTFDTAGLDLLRSSAIKLLKLDARLGAAALRDKLAQARVVALVQAAKVLGMHCVAKYVKSRSGREWMAAVGFDFAQSMNVEPLEKLAP